MPFTLCHPAIVLPLHRAVRRYTALSALVIGSMMPDFPYFYSLGVGGIFSHSPAGIVLYCVPMGALLYVEYVVLLRQPILAWLPPPISARLPWTVAWPAGRLRSACIVLLSLAIGAASHICWDSFTHVDALPVAYFAPLRTVVSVAGIDMPLFRVLQHGSTLLGFIAIAIYARLWFVRTVAGPHHPASLSSGQRLGAVAAVGAAGAVGALLGLMKGVASSLEHTLFNIVVTGMATAAVAIVLLCIGWQLRARRAGRQD